MSTTAASTARWRLIRDLKRERTLILDNWQRLGFTSAHARNEGAAIIKSVDALLGRPGDSRRLQAWEELLNQSMFRRPGRQSSPSLVSGPVANSKWSRLTLILKHSVLFPTTFISGGGCLTGRSHEAFRDGLTAL